MGNHDACPRAGKGGRAGPFLLTPQQRGGGVPASGDPKSCSLDSVELVTSPIEPFLKSFQDLCSRGGDKERGGGRGPVAGKSYWQAPSSFVGRIPSATSPPTPRGGRGAVSLRKGSVGGGGGNHMTTKSTGHGSI